MERKERKVVTGEVYQIIKRMLEDGKFTQKEIAASMYVCRQTISKIQDNIYKGIEFISATTKRKETVRQKKLKFDNEEQIIYNSIACNNTLTQKELKNKLQLANAKDISVPTICRKLKRIGITRKRLSLIPSERNSQQNIDLRAIYAQDITRINNENLVFLDETGFNLHLSRKYGYSPKNSKAFQNVPGNRGVNNSCLVVIGISGVIGFKLRKGAFNSEHFVAFVEECLVSYFQNNPNKIIVMDNAKFHHSKIVKEILNSNNIVFKYLPAYSPQLNPIEEFFSMLKARYITAKNSFNSIEDCLAHLLSLDYSIECANFYRTTSNWLEKARKKENFI